MAFTRSQHNPLISPDPKNPWEAKAAFNPSVVFTDGSYHMVYRALSEESEHEGRRMQVSTIGYASGTAKDVFTNHKQLLNPSEAWDKYGLEDPRITKIDDEFFVFYTALSDFPFSPSGIKIGVAVFKDFQTPAEKHLITPFNAKAMVLLPEKINGKYVALLTVNTDLPPSSIGVALFDRKEDIWSQAYWRTWYQNLHTHTLPLSRLNSDQLEVGAVPVRTDAGWLMLYAHIQHYYEEDRRIFGVEAVLLDANNPQKVLARTEGPVFTAKTRYEEEGIVPHVAFPSGATLEKDTLNLYYGGADTVCCLANCDISDLMKDMQFHSPVALKAIRPLPEPLLLPDTSHEWEAKAVFNPAAFYLGGTIHILYRAMGQDNTSVLGHATSKDGLQLDTRSEMPFYVPRAEFESKRNPGDNSGCEDPRITVIGDTIYMCYTAYDGESVPRVALTSISVTDFTNHKNNWTYPVLISPPGIDDKDAAIFPERINGKFVIAHRIQSSIVFDFVDSLEFDGKSQWLKSIAYIPPRGNSWDSDKIGLSAPPLKCDKGWVMLYHGISKTSHEYRVGALLLDLNNPEKVLARTPWPILEPVTRFEREGIVSNVVFPCGVVLKNDTLFIYYGGADSVTCAATLSFSELVTYLLNNTPQEE